MSIPLPAEYVPAFASWTLLAAELDVDGDGLAEARSTRGWVEFRPLEGGRETSVATVLHGRLRPCPVDAAGVMRDPVGSSSVALWVGDWRAVPHLPGFPDLPPRDFTLTASHTEAAPLDLSSVPTVVPAPGQPLNVLSVPHPMPEGKVLGVQSNALAWLSLPDPFAVITGVGRPDMPATLTTPVAALVAAAGSGVVFRSLDGPQGAWEWRKRGSTWVCEVGDTGARNIDSLLVNGWVGSLRLRLVNGTVFVNTSGLSGSASTSIDLATLPAGLRPGSAVYAGTGSIANAVAPAAAQYWGTLGGAQAEIIRAPQSLTSGRGQFFFTVSTWPLTLPGTAA